ncbi:hypothetical [Yersinia pestis KIM10+]|uniref:Uncharacterized protein n=1 Tax=Yersinia pestis TaxID=632 RepID=Q8CLE3_YERPE|nr:hypothetical [Yersinia pestis KIM10+]
MLPIQNGIAQNSTVAQEHRACTITQLCLVAFFQKDPLLGVLHHPHGDVKVVLQCAHEPFGVARFTNQMGRGG